MIRRRLALLALPLILLGCGGGDDDAGVEAREAVAGFLDALVETDASAACGSLTPEAQEQVGDEVARGLARLRVELADSQSPPPDVDEIERGLGDSCGEVLDSVFDLFGQLAGEGSESLDATADLAAEIRSGGDSVTVEITGATGTVTATEGDRTLPVEVAEVDGEWLVADARTLLFGTDAP